jgi:hypothetical protein
VNAAADVSEVSNAKRRPAACATEAYVGGTGGVTVVPRRLPGGDETFGRDDPEFVRPVVAVAPSRLLRASRVGYMLTVETERSVACCLLLDAFLLVRLYRLVWILLCIYASFLLVQFLLIPDQGILEIEFEMGVQ